MGEILKDMTLVDFNDGLICLYVFIYIYVYICIFIVVCIYISSCVYH